MGRVLKRPRIALERAEWAFIDRLRKHSGLSEGEVIVAFLRYAQRLVLGLTDKELTAVTARIFRQSG